MDFTLKQLDAQAISWDKLNMLRHVRFFKDTAGIRAQMDKHAALLRPKFDAVLSTLDAEIGSTGAGSWVKPKGGLLRHLYGHARLRQADGGSVQGGRPGDDRNRTVPAVIG